MKRVVDILIPILAGSAHALSGMASGLASLHGSWNVSNSTTNRPHNDSHGSTPSLWNTSLVNATLLNGLNVYNSSKSTLTSVPTTSIPLSSNSFANSSISNGFSGADSSTSTSANIFNNSTPSSGNLSFPNIILTNPSTLQQFECMKQWFHFDSMTRTDIEWVTTSTDYSSSLAIVQTYGIGDVYTTTDGIPVARGSFTPTRTVTSTAWRIEHQTFSVPSPGTKWLQSAPSCTSPPYWQQQSLCATYLSSLGVVQNGTAVNPVPATVTPVSFDSILCPLPYTDNTTCETRTYSYSSCYLEGRSVELYYFPPQTAIATEPKPGITTSVIYSFAPNITFTSPSIYLSFDYLTAFSYPPQEAGKCTRCSSGFCMSWDLDLGRGQPYTLSAVGTVITNKMLSTLTRLTIAQEMRLRGAA